MAPRVGPQGATVSRVADVARRGSAAMKPSTDYKITRVTPQSAPSISVEDLVSGAIGGPATTYGKKYGGLSTMDQFNTAVIGHVARVPELQRLAFQKAAEAQAALEAGRLYSPQSPADYDRVRAEEARIQEALARPITAPAAELAAVQARRAAILPAQQRLAEIETHLAKRATQTPGSLVGSRATDEVLRDEARMLRRQLGDEPTQQTEQAVRQDESDRLRQDAYARYMERMDVNPYYGETPREAALLNLGTPISGTALRTRVEPMMNVATELANLPRADLAQRIATEVYGMEPTLARGMFGGEFERDQRLRELADINVFPGQSIEEQIALTQGPDALIAYQQQQLANALAKQQEGFKTADEEAFDLSIEQQTGIPVEAAAGNYTLDTARRVLADPNFIDTVAESRQILMDSGATSLEEQRNAARNVAMNYFNATGDQVTAQILYNVLVSFDFTMAFTPLG